jgi:signal transduction histidine kinase
MSAMTDTRQAMTEQALEEQAALRRVATLVAGGAEPDEVFAAVADEVGRLLDVPIVQMSRYVSDSTVMVVGVSGDQPPFTQGSQWPLDGPTLSARVRATGRPARIDDYTHLPGTISNLVRQAGVRSGVGAPIVVNGELWGVIMGLATDEATLPVGIEERLLGFTELVGTAIANADARANLRRLVEEQAALSQVAVMVAEGARPEEVFAGVAEQVGRLLDVPAISMVRFEPDGTSTAIALWGDGNPFGVGARFEPWPGVMLQVRETGRPARLEDFAYSTGPTTARLQAARIHSGVGVPIIVDGRVWGTTIALATGGASLPEGVEERLSRFTRLVATAIGNTEARDELRELADEQAALRRVATLVAEGARPEDVLAAVASEIAQVLDVPLVGTYRYDSDQTATVVARWGEHRHEVGSTWPLAGPSVVAEVFRARQPARIDDYAGLHSELADLAREAGIRSCVGVPIIIDGGLWGVVTAATTTPEPLGGHVVARLTAFTELVGTAISNTQISDDLHRLADEQGALRRIATLVAEGVTPTEVYAAVSEEVANVLDVPFVIIGRHEPDGSAVVIGTWGDLPFGPGAHWTLEGPSIMGDVLRTGRPARIDDYSGLPGKVAGLARKAGIRSAVGAPVVVDGTVWGAIVVASSESEPVADRAETRLRGFTELLATAISNAANYSQLLASRARIVTAGDEARRRIERNLHDGTQQQLVSLGLDLQALKNDIPADLGAVRAEIARLQAKLVAVTDEIREISRGLHPSLLSHAGLAAALRSLARKAAAPVELAVELDHRLPPSIEIATYFVVSESLANAVKHADASHVRIEVVVDDRRLRAAVTDDGRGGAQPEDGSGLTGLIDRVEALGGRLTLSSPRGEGTAVSIELPLDAVVPAS